jgi:isopentenyldiphosphate isomerase
MKKDNNTELLPLVNEAGEIIGSATRGECHDGTKLLHPVVHLHLFNSAGHLYLQHRPQWKTIQPGKWDTAVGGHVDYGENVSTALKREVSEELGITDCEPHLLNSYLFESEREKELIYVYSAVYDGVVTPSDELDGGRFWTLDEIKAAMGKDVLTPNFEMEFLKVMEWMKL